MNVLKYRVYIEPEGQIQRLDSTFDCKGDAWARCVELKRRGIRFVELTETRRPGVHVCIAAWGTQTTSTTADISLEEYARL